MYEHIGPKIPKKKDKINVEIVYFFYCGNHERVTNHFYVLTCEFKYEMY